MNDALFVLIMVGLIAILIGVSDWRCDRVRREMEIETDYRVRREMAAWAIGACMQCPRRHPAARPIQDADRQAAVAEAERLMRERRGEGTGR